MDAKKGSTPAKRASPESAVTDPRFASSSWDPRFSRVPKRAKKAIDDERFSRKLKTNAGFRGSQAPVDRFGRPKLGHARLNRSLRELADGSDEEEDGLDEIDNVGTGGRAMVSGVGLREESSSDESEDDDEFMALEEEVVGEDIPRGEATQRLAVLGLDWSTTRAVDIYASLSCFCPPGKRIEYVEVHPSKFGLQRLAVEANFGPQVTGKTELRVVKEARERNLIHEGGTRQEGGGSGEVGSDGEEEGEEDEELGLDEDSDDDDAETRAWKSQASLRKYEEERLRYYYGVVQFEDMKSADAVYEQCDGVEYAQSGRAFDLRFIPDDMVIETKPRDRAVSIPDRYKPPNVVPSTLNNSTVKMSWDADDPDRIILKKKTMGKHDLDEENLKAYLAGSSDDEAKATQAEVEAKKNLLLGALEEGEDEDGGMDMEVSFEPGMLEKGEEIVKRKQEREERRSESEWEARLRRQEERKSEKRRKRREMVAGKVVHRDIEEGNEEQMDGGENPRFDDDPLFSVDRRIDEAMRGVEQEASLKKKGKKKNKKGDLGSRMEKEAEGREGEAYKAKRVAEVDDEVVNIRQRLAEAESDSDEERGKGRGGRRRKGRLEDRRGDKVAAMDTKDGRFQGLFQSHLYAMDPTHPKFRGDETSKAILREQASRSEEIGKVEAVKRKGKVGKSGEKKGGGISEAMEMVARIKAKAAAKRRAKRKGV